RAKARRPVRALISDDLPTLERPANATSMPRDAGSASKTPAAATKFHSPANSRRPSSLSAAEKSDGSAAELTGPSQRLGLRRAPPEPKSEHAVPPQTRVAPDCERRRWTTGRAFGSATW